MQELESAAPGLLVRQSVWLIKQKPSSCVLINQKLFLYYSNSPLLSGKQRRHH